MMSIILKEWVTRKKKIIVMCENILRTVLKLTQVEKLSKYRPKGEEFWRNSAKCLCTFARKRPQKGK